MLHVILYMARELKSQKVCNVYALRWMMAFSGLGLIATFLAHGSPLAGSSQELISKQHALWRAYVCIYILPTTKVCKWSTPSQSIVMCLWSHRQLRLIVGRFFWTIKHANDWLVTSNCHFNATFHPSQVSSGTYIAVRHISPWWAKRCITVTI